METGGSTDPVRGEEAVTFAQALEALKQRGSALLVTGRVPEEMYLRSSSQMLGDRAATPPRRRLVAVPEVGDEDLHRIEESGSTAPEWSRIVVCGEQARSAAASPGRNGDFGAATPSSPASDGPIKRELAADGIADLGQTISTVIDEFDRAAAGLEPAELRVAFDCLPALLSNYETVDVFRFLHAFTYDVRRVSGMGHVWLPQPRTSEMASTLSHLFDAVIELGVVDESLRQRWYFRDVDLVSEWLPID